LEQAAKEGDGIPIAGGVQETCGHGTKGHGGVVDLAVLG